MLIVLCEHPGCAVSSKAFLSYEDITIEDPGWLKRDGKDYCPAHEAVYWRAKHGPITESDWRMGQLMQKVYKSYVTELVRSAPKFTNFASGGNGPVFTIPSTHERA